MAHLLMPKLGLTMTEGLLSEWRTGPGKAFGKGDVLFVVETDKVANEIEAEADGTIAEILVQEGETVPVGVPLARLAGSDGAASPASSHADAPDRPADARRDGPQDPSAHNAPSPAGRIVATPLARRMAREKGVALAEVKGSGPRGRIKAADVEAAAVPARAPAAAVPETGLDRIPADPVRQATARRVVAANRDIPQFHVESEAGVGPLMDLRATLNAEPGRTRVTVTHLVLKAVGLALAELPETNRIWLDGEIGQFRTADVGMVVETPEGLRIPVLRDVGRQTLDAVAEDAAGLAARAREGALRPGDVSGGAISVSNVGMFGVRALAPIVNPPQSMILGLGAERAVFRPDAAGAPALRREVTLTLVCDHRVLDGAVAARFLGRLVGILETPLALLRPPRPAMDQTRVESP